MLTPLLALIPRKIPLENASAENIPEKYTFKENTHPPRKIRLSKFDNFISFFFLVSLKSADERDREESTRQKYLKYSEKEPANPFFFCLKDFHRKLWNFLAVMGAKLKTKNEEKNVGEQSSKLS